MRILISSFVTAFLLCVLPASAEDTALILTTGDYDNGQQVPYANRASRIQDDLSSHGFRVVLAEETTLPEAYGAIGRFAKSHGGDGRLVMVLGGQFVARAGNVWWLSREADRVPALRVGSVGVPVSALLDLAARAPGQAIVMLATDDQGDRIPHGLPHGLRNLDIPQGVTLLTGSMPDLTELLVDRVLEGGDGLAQALQRQRDVTARGYLSAEVFAPASGGVGSDESGFWRAVEQIDSEKAYNAYLDSYPRGRFADDARAQLKALKDDPYREARRIEEALGLTTDARRAIQRDLTILGFDTRGIDGVLGRRSRAAIRAWQQSSDLTPTSFLSGNQITRLHDAGETRRAELEEEARRKRAEEERRDKQYWGQLNEGRDEDGLRAYLDRYPDGFYSDIARQRLAVIENERRARATADERNFWAQVQADDTIPAYRAYLNNFPDGAFAGAARARISEIRMGEANEEEIARARASESQTMRGSIARLLVEQQLTALGLETGPVDGRFDEHTRRAIRRYQRAHSLSATGYVDRTTAIRILSGR